MKKVLRYELRDLENLEVELHRDSKILKVDVASWGMVLWVESNPNACLETRRFFLIAGEGEPPQFAEHVESVIPQPVFGIQMGPPIIHVYGIRS